MDSQGLRHLPGGDEELGENSLVGLYQGILWLGDIEGYTALVGINNYFNTVANIV
ncbi:hypothetical protein ES703_78823 [subsurface metagenome]